MFDPERRPQRGREHALFWIGVAICQLAATPSLATTPTQLPDPLPLSWSIERGLSRNTALAVIEATSALAAEQTHSTGRMEDPRIGYQLVNVPVDDGKLDKSPMSGHQFELRQKLPFPGKLRSRSRAAESISEAASFEVQHQRLRLAAEIEEAWSQLAYYQNVLEVCERNLEILRQLREVTEARYGVGSGLQQDVLRAQVALSRMSHTQLGHEASLRESEARLAALLDLPAEQQFPRTDDAASDDAIPDLADVLAQLDASSPLLRSRRAEIEAAGHALKATRLDGYPDFDIGLAYRIREKVDNDPASGDDFISAGVTVRLPVRRAKWNSRRAEEEIRLRAARARLRASQTALADSVRRAHSDLVRADAEIELLSRGLLLQVRQSLESSRSGYKVGRIDFLSLLDSELGVYEVEIELLEAQAERRASFARLEATLGRRLR